VTFAFINEIVELPYDFGSAFCGVEFEGFERGAIVFTKAVERGFLAPDTEYMISKVNAPDVPVGDWRWIKVSKAW